MNSQGGLFIISGPSGVGKSTVLKKVFEKVENCMFSISATTRLPREGETDGIEYYFISREKFIEMIEKGEFLEYAEYVGNFYGTPKKPILENLANGKNVFLDIEVKGCGQVREKMPEAVSIFIAPPNIEALEERLRGRKTEGEDKIKKRLEKAMEELEFAGTYDYIVVNDTPEHAAGEIIEIINNIK